MNKLLDIVRIIVSAILCIILLLLFANSADVITQLAFSPFLLAAIETLGSSIATYKENGRLVVFFQKSYIITFLVEALSVTEDIQKIWNFNPIE